MNHTRERGALRKAFAGLAFVVCLVSTPLSAQVDFSTDFEGPTGISKDNWQVFVNYFDPTCTAFTANAYGFPAPDAGPQTTALAPGSSSQVMNTYSNYDDGTHSTQCLEVNIYQQLDAIAASDVGNYDYSLDVELPPDPLNVGANVNLFIRVFAPGFSSVLSEVVVPATPGTQTVPFEIDRGFH